MDDAAGRDRRIPLWLKIAYSGFVAVLVPVYTWHHGLENFLWFSNVALLLTVPALWLESSWLASMLAVSVSLLEMAWIIDFTGGLLTGGGSLIGLADYMFDPNHPLFVRLLSLYHLVLPFLLLWLVYRLGYQPRAWLAQTALAWVILVTTYLVAPPEDNVNWVRGWGGRAQAVMPPDVYLAGLMLAFPLGVYLPSHLLFRWGYGRLGRLAGRSDGG